MCGLIAATAPAALHQPASEEACVGALCCPGAAQRGRGESAPGETQHNTASTCSTVPSRGPERTIHWHHHDTMSLRRLHISPQPAQRPLAGGPCAEKAKPSDTLQPPCWSKATALTLRNPGAGQAGSLGSDQALGPRSSQRHAWSTLQARVRQGGSSHTSSQQLAQSEEEQGELTWKRKRQPKWLLP